MIPFRMRPLRRWQRLARQPSRPSMDCSRTGTGTFGGRPPGPCDRWGGGRRQPRRSGASARGRKCNGPGSGSRSPGKNRRGHHPALADLLKDKDASVRYAAARSLGKTDAEAKAIAHDLVYVGRDAEHRARYARQSQECWDSLMREAGEAKEGLVLEARPNTPSPSSGEERGLIISLKNVGDLPFEAGWVCLSPLAYRSSRCWRGQCAARSRQFSFATATTSLWNSVGRASTSSI